MDVVLSALREGTDRLAAAGVTSPGLDAALLLARALGVPKHVLRLEPQRAVPDGALRAFRDLVGERARRRPLSQVLGTVEFRSLSFAVTPRVLTPRPETEALVEVAVAALDAAGRAEPRCGEAGVGSGCVSVTVAVLRPTALVVASDVSGHALDVAAGNAARHGVAERVRLVRGDFWEPLRPFAPFDVLVTNPPYVRRSEAGELDPEVLFEPSCAVFCDGEPADLYVRLATEAAPLLRPGGTFAAEWNGEDPTDLVGRVRHLSDPAGRPLWNGVTVDADLAGRPRVLRATRNA